MLWTTTEKADRQQMKKKQEFLASQVGSIYMNKLQP